MNVYTVELRVVYEAEDSQEAEDILTDLRDALKNQPVNPLIHVDSAREATPGEVAEYGE